MTAQESVDLVRSSETANEKLGGHEVLADSIITSSEDDSYAIQFSILEHGDLKFDTAQWPWRIGMPVMMVIGFLFKCIVLVYLKFAPKPIPRDRKLLGPRMLNRLLGLIVHPFIETVREGVTTSQALDALYAANRYFPAYFKSMILRPWLILRVPGALLTWYVCNIVGPNAVRNRLRIVFVELLKELRRQAALGKKEIWIHELAAGSAEAAIFAVWQFRQERSDVQVHLVLVDLSKSSLQRAKRLADSKGVKVKVVLQDLKKYLRSLDKTPCDILEVVGFFDYRKPDSLVALASQIHEVLAVDGTFIGAHIAPHACAFVTENFIGWPELIRRTETEYRELLWRAGWNKIRMITEPYGEHMVSVAYKLKA